ncbi:class I SAM-dependent methyltransferase [Aquipseudomonas campi]|uniref:Class I SAM-dependent methyltransferase n=1 Tax=Aquipseudomonas campi TaxID=2731681 RepID=A0A6M8FTU6_9GAMM|nr:class I SAM-dependent methyltransferase [Pseudomonas campi]QKE64248.1 class I SAM-dependent methyltransferase [Pseudomonas campi]
MLVWEGNRFSIGDRKFQIMVELTDLYTLKNQDGFILGKPRRYLDKYCEHLAGKTFQNIFELGIFRGGSTIFLNEMFKPEKLVAIDFNSQPVGILNRYAQEPGNSGAVLPFYGVDQSDVSRLSDIYHETFGSAPLDLVVDDASHFLDETRASFNFLFPKLRAGGTYIIEDWAWAHQACDFKGLNEGFAEKPSMANLIIDIVLASVAAPGLFDEVSINDGFVMVTKGATPIDGEFDIRAYNFHRGQVMGQQDYFA